jgi:hypothetical protein
MIHHFIISFDFLIFSSSHPLSVICSHPKTIDQTAKNPKYNAIFFTQFEIFN